MLFVCAVLFFLTATSSFAGTNFIASGSGVRPEYIRVAEQARMDIAVFWTGKQLPGSWAKPCVLIVDKEGEHVSPGGRTSMVFDRGEVYGWVMHVQGSQKEIKNSVIPHEVAHTILASIRRKKTARWLDEGLASLFEDMSQIKPLRQSALKFYRHQYSVFRQLDNVHYPDDSVCVRALYATGFSFVEWLLVQKGKDVLWKFAVDKRKPTEKFKSFYGVSLLDAQQDWEKWLKDYASSDQPILTYPVFYQDASGPKTSKPVLFIVTRSGNFCPGCYSFHQAYKNNKTFRDALHSRYTVKEVDSSDPKNMRLLRKLGVTSVPAFCPNNATKHVEGWGGSDWIIKKLDQLPKTKKKIIKTVNVLSEVPAPPPPPSEDSPLQPVQSIVPRPVDGVAQPYHRSLCPKTRISACRCSSAIQSLNKKLVELERRIAVLESHSKPVTVTGRLITSARVKNGQLEFKYSDSPDWSTVGPVQGSEGKSGRGVDSVRITANGQLELKYTDGENWFALGPVRSTPTVPVTSSLEKRITALEPLLKREVRVYIGGKLVDSLSGDEALKPTDPIPIYLVPQTRKEK